MDEHAEKCIEAGSTAIEERHKRGFYGPQLLFYEAEESLLKRGCNFCGLPCISCGLELQLSPTHIPDTLTASGFKLGTHIEYYFRVDERVLSMRRRGGMCYSSPDIETDTFKPLLPVSLPLDRLHLPFFCVLYIRSVLCGLPIQTLRLC